MTHIAADNLHQQSSNHILTGTVKTCHRACCWLASVRWSLPLTVSAIVNVTTPHIPAYKVICI